MSVQDTYLDNMVAGKAGAIVNTESHNLISRDVEDTQGLEFGVPVARGANDNGCKLRAAGESIIGISVRERSLDANTPNSFPQYASARIMTSGVIWVEASVAVNAGDEVRVVDSTGVWTNTGGTQLVGAEWDSSTTAAGLAKVRFK